MQDMMARLTPHTDALDDHRSLRQPAGHLLACIVHARAGARFAEWLRSDPDPLTAHLATVRAAARFSAELSRQIREHDSHTQLRVRPRQLSIFRTPTLCTPVLPSMMADGAETNVDPGLHLVHVRNCDGKDGVRTQISGCLCD